MTENEFFNQLREALTAYPEEETKRQISYYQEMLADMREDGMTEEEAVKRLGNPQEIARNIQEELPLMSLVKARTRPRGGWRAREIVLLVLGSPIWLSLLIAALAVVLSVGIALWAVIAAFAVTALAVLLSGVVLAVASLFSMAGNFPAALLTLGGGIFAVGLGGLMALAAIWLIGFGCKCTRMAGRGLRNVLIERRK